MEQIRHGSATTTHAVRAVLQRSKASLAQLSLELGAWSLELGINPKTVAKFRKRQTVVDLKTGPNELRSTVLTEAEEAAIIPDPVDANLAHHFGADGGDRASVLLIRRGLVVLTEVAVVLIAKRHIDLELDRAK